MQSATPFIDAALARSRELDRVLPLISAQRRASATVLARSTIAADSAETWKYLPIAPFLSEPFGVSVESPTDANSISAQFLTFPGALPIRIEGSRPIADESRFPAGVRLTTLRRSVAPVELNASIDLERYPLAHVNTALLDDALLLAIEPGIDAGRIDLRFGSGDDAAIVSRVRIELGPGSRLRLVEQHAEDRPTNAIVDFAIGQGAALEHTRLLPASTVPGWLLATVHVGRDGIYELVGHALGSPTRRNDVHVRLDGERARTQIDLKCAAHRKDKLDHHIVVEHLGVDTFSRQTVHGLATNQGELTFDGRIHIRPGAQRSDARLTNKNLLLDRRARINAKPELEIYANDVKCSHGATVGQLDPNHVFYLRSRGVDEASARAMLTRAFLTIGLSDELRVAGVLDLYAEFLAS
jgi:Fe-S cluster assembly protein SufD